MSGIDTFYARVGTFFYLGCDLLCMRVVAYVVTYYTCHVNIIGSGIHQEKDPMQGCAQNG